MVVKVLIASLLILASASTLIAQNSDLQSISLSWDLRGSLAVTRMNGLIDELEVAQKAGSCERTLTVSPEIAIESAYSLHKNLPEVARKKVDTGLICHLVLNAGELGLFDLAYQYDKGGELVSTYIDRLPEGWRVRLPEDDFHSIIVRTDKEQVFAFPISEPLKAVYWEK